MTAQSLAVGFILAPLELAVLRQAFGVRSRLYPLRLGNVTVDPVGFAAVAAAVREALDRRGLAEGGQPVETVQTAFELLADHRIAVSITGAGARPGEDLTVLVVSDGLRALSITQPADHELRFAVFPHDELIGAVVAVLPPARAAAELAGPRVGGGLLVASGWGRHGRWTETLGWVDTPSGRHLVRTAADRSGNRSADYRPAGPAELTAAVTELLAADR